MSLHVLDEIIDAMLQNEGRPSPRPGAGRPLPQTRGGLRFDLSQWLLPERPEDGRRRPRP
jgi:hypothetical protein